MIDIADVNLIIGNGYDKEVRLLTLNSLKYDTIELPKYN